MTTESVSAPAASMTFLQELEEQRWDDHRYYHRSRVNQSLHFFSACSFLTTYALVPFYPAEAALIGWMVAMVSRQSGHFFFEPKGFDDVNNVTFQHKEDIKVGFNLRRKVILHAIWAALPVMLLVSPTFLGLLTARPGFLGYIHNLGILWLTLGLGALAARTIYLMVTRGVQTGLCWCTKILTDPFHDFWIYRGAPLRLLSGEMLDPMTHVHAEQ